MATIRRHITNPVLLAVTTLLGIPLAIYLFYLAKEAPRLTYYVNPATAVVVSTGQASRLRVLHDDRPIDGDITAVQVAIWNAGKRSIKPDNILRSVTIRTADSAPILEASLRKTTRDVIDVVMDETATKSGSLGLHWRILEQNDGFILQILVAGSAERAARLEMTGVIEGQSEPIRPAQVAPEARTQTAMDRWLETYWGRVSFGTVALSGLASVIVVRSRRRRRKRVNREASVLTGFFDPDLWLFTLTLAFGFGVVRLLWIGNVDPPIGF